VKECLEIAKSIHDKENREKVMKRLNELHKKIEDNESVDLSL